MEVLRLGDVVETALKGFPDEGINTYLYDASAKKGNRLLYAHPSRMPGMTGQPMDEEVIEKDIQWSNNFEIAGRQWKILFSPSPFFLESKQSWQSWLILSGSLLLTAILLLYLLNKLNYTTEIESRVREQLQTNQELANEITTRKRAEEALQEYSERLEEMVEERTKDLLDTREQLVRGEKLAILGQLAGGVAHELRNPLAVMSSAIYYLRSINTDADETTRKYLERISSAVGNAEAIISDLLDFSRTKSLEREEVTASELVARVLEKQPPPEKMKVTSGIPPELPPVFVDPRQIGQALGNLVANAYQAMPDGGQVTITAELIEADPIRDPKSTPEEYASHSTRQAIRIRITDTGCGISKENMEKIFEPLFTTRARGIGLGLAVSRNLVELNGGSIEAQSEAGKGSTFTVALPIKEAVS